LVGEFGKDQQDVTVLKKVSEAILRSFNENQFQRGYLLAVLVDAYMHHYDGFRSQIKIETAFKICLYLNGHGTKKCADTNLVEKMMRLSRVLLKEVLQAAKAIRLSLTALSIEELNSLVGLLGGQQNYDDLEVRYEIDLLFLDVRSLTSSSKSGSYTNSGPHAIRSPPGHHPPSSQSGESSSNAASPWATAMLPFISQKTSATT